MTDLIYQTILSIYQAGSVKNLICDQLDLINAVFFPIDLITGMSMSVFGIATADQFNLWCPILLLGEHKLYVAFTADNTVR